MRRIEESLERRCRDEPDAEVTVVVVVVAEHESTRPEDIGLRDSQPIPYQPGMFRARLSGGEVLSLAERPEIDEISEDLTAHGLS